MTADRLPDTRIVGRKDRRVVHHVKHEHASTSAGHTRHLGDCPCGVLQVLDDSFGARRVEGRVLESECLGFCDIELGRQMTPPFSSSGDHFGGHVHADHAPARTHEFGQVGAHLTKTASDVEYRPTLRHT
jgi:hypothetical protein